MKHIKKQVLLFLFTVCPLLSLHAFFESDFRKFNMQDGLADNSVFSIHKDKDGFIWFGTGNGLSRYDGKIIKSFGTEQYNLKVSQIYESSHNLLWFISNSILYCLDRHRECFIPVSNPSNGGQHYTNDMILVDETHAWSVTTNKLQLLKLHYQRNEQGEVTSVSIQVEAEYALCAENEALMHACLSPHEKSIYVVSNRCKLLLFDTEKRKKVVDQCIIEKSDKSITPSSILCDSKYVWISFIGAGITRYHIGSGQYDRMVNTPNSPAVLSHNGVYAFVPIQNQGYLAATWNGYTLLTNDKQNPSSGIYTTEIHDKIAFNLRTNIESRMISAYYDSKGLLYIGTNGGGVIVSDLREQFYKQFHQERYNEICGIVTDRDERVWLATFHEGLLRSTTPADSTHRPLSFAAVDDPSIREKKTVLCALKDEEGNLWFGNSDASLTRYHMRSKEFTVYCLPETPGRQLSTYVWTLFIDRQQRFWVGTRNGLFLFDRQTGTAHPVMDATSGKRIDTSVRAMAQGKNDEIWLGTLLGLQKITFRNGKAEATHGFEEKLRLNDSDVRSLLSSSDGHLYVGYAEGLGIITLGEDTIETFYTTHDGLCSNFIGCITEDSKGQIWLGTNSGISRYSRHQKLFYNYYISGSNRSATSIHELLLFGNNNSLTYFDPSDIPTSPHMEKVLPLSLEVNNKPVAIGETRNGQVILPKGIAYSDRITLNHANRDFTLLFSNLSYYKGLQKYNYRLLPYQKEWLVSEEGKASYTSLPPGLYTFEVKSLYPEGMSSEVTQLSIEILPHWREAAWFRFCIFLFIAGVVYYVISYFRRRQKRIEREMKLEHELHLANVEKEKEKQIREERENFFTNVAHELRTPLTLLISPLQELLQKTKLTDTARPSLTLMHKNGVYLQQLVDDLLCVQKIEAGMVKLHLSEANTTGIISDVVAPFEQMALSQKLDFSIKWPQEPIYLWIDVPKLSSAVRNLLSNAFKYTAPGGRVELAVKLQEIDGQSFCLISVSDNGIGISPQCQERIFDSFITDHQEPMFSTKIGIGLRIVRSTMDLHHGRVTVESAPGQGSTFTLFIPQGRSHFADDECDVASHPSTESTPPTPTGKYSLLIIEDNLDMRTYIASLFQKKYTLLEAEDGEEGLRIATEKVPHLIISDVMMPIKDGFTCCREIRTQPQTAHIPILMLTAKAEDTDIMEGIRTGADEYMMKPFNPEILKAKVERLIAQREQLKRIYTKSLILKHAPLAEEGQETDAFMQKVINIVEMNLTDESFTVQTLARALNMSQPTLYRKIKQRSNLSIIEVIRSVRMSKAAGFVMENRYSIQEIAEMVGYNDSNTFRKHFTEQFGVPPSKYLQL